MCGSVQLGLPLAFVNPRQIRDFVNVAISPMSLSA
jgi:hypothetical protein